MSLSKAEIERYARHLVLREVGGPGQAKLQSARVFMIGAGGLGSPVLQYLAAAGVGTIGICDPDVVSLSNLQRQTIFSTSDVGRGKVDAAADSVASLNPHVVVEAHRLRLDADNVDALVGAYDLIIDGSDNFETRYVASDACYRQARPLVTGAVGRFDGSLTTLTPYARGANGEPNPTYRCLFPEAPPEGTVPTCEQAGVLGALTGLIGSLMAMEALRILLGLGDPLVGRLLLVDALEFRFETLRYAWDPNNPLNGSSRL